jgi:hypothetical protein
MSRMPMATMGMGPSAPILQRADHWEILHHQLALVCPKWSKKLRVMEAAFHSSQIAPCWFARDTERSVAV